MTAKTQTETRTKPVQLRIRTDISDMIDQAARAQGKTRSDFMIDAARRAAEDALLDRTLVRVDAESFRHYLDVLDQSPGGEGYTRLMNAPKPWQS
ncbi:DUF1778 domain-containing protein [Ciceribacter ferrooxidans]|uniref:DUF1778 domain-containing protein n=1 Tax=Ciceribacter ferrooxidans TaxID=2509717 RepID=A0A4Q2T565_9HYPH|nr:DUF1778 domain-containing protein [Ciceribacter ferrooxidans]RYC13926.1 DUF1778 domain-containing protein [Ciceribacter ferrooxidans]